ncbi:hypothetical protein L207DRAFT_582082 [Hyaloscypha variabilis F]|uniref:Uncharacterized protein n=1 Tax=Hyaloscypha variabilis (strain UAMH 11265 / GT02V1 / F) TaxID=1149755 RepID=A0A2J6RT10_HYAVF|nr:hypothetical protein L207DRAFT_582082 [Hyaloscypha variabilis F]
MKELPNRRKQRVQIRPQPEVEDNSFDGLLPNGQPQQAGPAVNGNIADPDPPATPGGINQPTNEQFINLLFGPGAPLHIYAAAARRIPETFHDDFRHLSASVVNIEHQIRQRLERIDVNTSTFQGYLNEMNDRQEVINTRIEAFEERLATIVERGAAVNNEQGNMFDVVNQIYVDIQAQRTIVQGVANQVGFRHPNAPLPAAPVANATPINAAVQPQAVERPAVNGFVGILAAVVLILGIAILKWIEMQAK